MMDVAWKLQMSSAHSHGIVGVGLRGVAQLVRKVTFHLSHTRRRISEKSMLQPNVDYLRSTPQFTKTELSAATSSARPRQSTSDFVYCNKPTSFPDTWTCLPERDLARTSCTFPHLLRIAPNDHLRVPAPVCFEHREPHSQRPRP